MVSYVCEDFVEEERWEAPQADSDESTDSGDDGVLEALYIFGEFKIVILSAEQSGSLFTWLNDIAQHQQCFPF